MSESDRGSTTAFDPEKFEHKYEHYFAELEQAYSRAFDTMHAGYDSGIVHAIDQQVLAESEPLYEGNGEFRIALPEAPAELLGEEYTDEEIADVLKTYVEQLERELQSVFGFR
ncbi:hypothetical protein BRC62_04655 [Halobacteriales archaeon QH_10_67_13]|nr:MAG: hypothetical protein BRC62_04655 [Halobacteriales archaeon QH_10_67_13]